jgi:hypothetical protein
MTSLPQWLGFGLTLLVVVTGTGANLFFMGRFVGKWGELMTNLTRGLAKIEERMEGIEDREAERASKVDIIDQRLTVQEQATQKFWEMRDEFTAMRTAIEIEGKYARENSESIKRSIAVIERQLANLATTRTEVIRLDSENKN